MYKKKTMEMMKKKNIERQFKWEYFISRSQQQVTETTEIIIHDTFTSTQ